MTSIDPKQTGRIAGPGDLRDQMRYAPGPVKIGMEIEFHVLDTRMPGAARPAQDEQMLRLKRNLRAQDIAVDDEIAAHMVEVKTDAYTLEELPQLVRELGRLQGAVVDESARLGLKPVPFGRMAGLGVRDGLANLIRPTQDDLARGARPRMMMDGLARMGMHRVRAYPLQNVSAQASIGARDAGHMFAMIRRYNTMLPFLFTVMHGRPPSFGRDGRMSRVNTGISARRGLGARGLVAPFYGSSRDAAQYIDQYCRTVYERKMVAFIDLAQQFRAAAHGETMSLARLQERGLATQANALLSQSMDWYSAKMKTIPGTDYMRAELRDMDTGPHQAVSLAVMAALTNMDEDCGARLDDLLARYGYGADPAASAPLLARDLRAAERDGYGLARPYGTGRMDEFARAFMALLAPYAARYGVEDAIGPLRHACVSGVSEAAAVARILPDRAAVTAFQRDYDTAVMAVPGRSFARDLARPPQPDLPAARRMG